MVTGCTATHQWNTIVASGLSLGLISTFPLICQLSFTISPGLGCLCCSGLRLDASTRVQVSGCILDWVVGNRQYPYDRCKWLLLLLLLLLLLQDIGQPRKHCIDRLPLTDQILCLFQFCLGLQILVVRFQVRHVHPPDDLIAVTWAKVLQCNHKVS
jgi:hypothetical protein